MVTTFDWDSEKARTNFNKHRVSFEEASSIFADPLYIMFLDEEHSREEQRFITIGYSDKNRLLLVAHTDRNGRIRIISAREATNNERRFYEQSA